MVFSHPDMGKRHVLFPMYSLWMPVIESAGSRTSVALTQTFLISVPTGASRCPMARSTSRLRHVTWSSRAAPVRTEPRPAERFSHPFHTDSPHQQEIDIEDQPTGNLGSKRCA